MKIDELISELEEVREEHGNLEVKISDSHGHDKLTQSHFRVSQKHTERNKFFLIYSLV